MNEKQKKSLREYMNRVEGDTIDPFHPSIGDKRDQPGYEGWIYGKDGFKIYLGIEPDGSRHT